MRVVVCVKQLADGELNPFDACAYEAALRIPDREVILLSMGPEKTKDMLQSLTRLGAKEAYLLCDHAFAGADTLATAYTLALAIKRLAPDLVICGRQTIDGDTAQTGPALSVEAGLSLIPNVMEICQTKEKLVCKTRHMGEQSVLYPALITMERVYSLRLPSIRSKCANVTVWNADDLQADRNFCGQKGSPTKVTASFRNEEGKRRCKWISMQELESACIAGLRKETERIHPGTQSEKKWKDVWIVGHGPQAYAQSISNHFLCIEKPEEEQSAADCREFARMLAEKAKKEQPEVILWGSDPWSKAVAPQTAVLLRTGLCADCTALEIDGDCFYMYRPAFSGNLIAKIVCTTKPQMATVRTLEEKTADLILSVGKGARGWIDRFERYVQAVNETGYVCMETAASRGAVDARLMPYEKQVGVTGKNVNPPIYLAVGISGAVHHISGMKQSGTVIAVNPDRKAPIFDYADYGVMATAQELCEYLDSCGDRFLMKR